ncbi:hypothetical protein EYF80_016146 [Liparis tanakae]|uniref:Uncharacterized protein n=1 Tax=Liparis tanakae TaxID=230148 RepID=A0A4Z2I709_9TELE|nr:hypothetical protein EYF80_016146 [Liparis tanakae]
MERLIAAARRRAAFPSVRPGRVRCTASERGAKENRAPGATAGLMGNCCLCHCWRSEREHSAASFALTSALAASLLWYPRGPPGGSRLLLSPSSPTSTGKPPDCRQIPPQILPVAQMRREAPRDFHRRASEIPESLSEVGVYLRCSDPDSLPRGSNHRCSH